MSDKARGLTEVYDEVAGSRKAFEGLQILLAGSNSDKVDTEMLSQLIYTCNYRLHSAEKQLNNILQP